LAVVFSCQTKCCAVLLALTFHWKAISVMKNCM